MDDSNTIANSSASPPFPSSQSTTSQEKPEFSNAAPGSNLQSAQKQQTPVQQATTPPQSSLNTSEGKTPIVTRETRRFPRFAIFLVIILIILAVVWSVVGYLYLQNNKGADDVKTNLSQIPTETPTPPFSPEQIKVKNGNIVHEIPLGETKVLVEKSDYSGTGITGFAKAVVSPDGKSICFESWPPAPKPALYFSDIKGGNVVEVSKNKKNCLWTTNSKSIIYTNEASPTSTVDIYIYDISEQKETNITGDSIPIASTYAFELVGLSADGSDIICTYSPSSSEKSPSNCSINIQTLQISIKSIETSSPSAITASPTPF